MKRIKGTDEGDGHSAPPITAILSYSKGFACAFGSGTVCLFEKKGEDSYSRSKEIQVNTFINKDYNNNNFLQLSPCQENVVTSQR